ncbi:hypothetical protein OIY81_3346, partial [Cryptosporidium canis]
RGAAGVAQGDGEALRGVRPGRGGGHSRRVRGESQQRTARAQEQGQGQGQGQGQEQEHGPSRSLQSVLDDLLLVLDFIQVADQRARRGAREVHQTPGDCSQVPEPAALCMRLPNDDPPVRDRLGERPGDTGGPADLHAFLLHSDQDGGQQGREL